MTTRKRSGYRQRVGAIALLIPLPSATSLANTVVVRNQFCVSTEDRWSLQPYAPLVDVKKGTRYVQTIYTGSWLQRVLVKTYNARTELMYEYKFGEDGKLTAFHGHMIRWGRWVGEADLSPDEDGALPKLEVVYRLSQSGGIISSPEEGGYYTKVFSTAPVYRTIAEIPCAVLLKEAEKKNNATQE